MTAVNERDRAALPPPLVLYAGTVTAAGAALLAAAVAHLAGGPPQLPLVLALGIGVAVCTAMPFHTDSRPDSEAVHADDVLMVAALSLLSLPGAVTVAVVGGVLSPVARRLFGSREKLRTLPPLKSAFNSSLAAIHGAVAAGFVHAVGIDDDLLLTAVVAIVATFLGNLVTRLAVAYAIQLSTQRSAATVFLENAGSALLGVTGAASLGLLLTLVLAAYDADVALVAVIVVTIVAGSRALNRHFGDRTSVTDLLQAAEEIHRSVDTADVERAAIAAANRLLRTSASALHDEPVPTETGVCVAVPSRESPPRWLVVERDRGSDRVIHEDERPLVEALATIIASARDNAHLVQRLGHSDRTRGALLASLSHDLRSPLAAALTTARTLLQHRIEATTARHLLEGQERALTRMEAILTDLIELERAELTPDRSATCSVADVVGATLDGLELPGEPELRIDVPDLRVEVEPRALGRVVENLLTNAAKHTPLGGPVWVRAWDEGGSVVLAVEDAGAGVDPAVREQILRPFAQADDAQRPSGIGLGLFVASRFLQLYGARLTVEDREGGGASFRVRLWSASD